MRYRFKKQNVLFIIFFFLIVIVLFLQEDYIEDSEINYTNAIKKEINTLIYNKLIYTYQIAEEYAYNRDIVKILKNQEYDRLYKYDFSSIDHNFKYFKNIWIHIVDSKGIQRYLSWTHKSVGESILKARADLAYLLKHPKKVNNISVGHFDITFKGIVPIKDGKTLLGLMEVITHFNSISKSLVKNDIYSAVVIDKRFNKQLKYPLSHFFIDGYNISNLDLDKKISTILDKKGIEYFINIKKYDYIFGDDISSKGYYVVSVPIHNKFFKKPIGYYIAFIQDNKMLSQKEIVLHFITIILFILFVYMTVLVFKEQKRNESLIRELDNKVEEKTKENLKLIYTDHLTGAYKKTKLDMDMKTKSGIYSHVVMFDIKNFRKINDIYGFKKGDKVLKIVTKRVKKILKRDIYRINADEFVFLSNDFEEEIDMIRKMFYDDPIRFSDKEVVFRLFFSFAVNKIEENALRKLSIATVEAKHLPFKKYIIYKEKHIDTTFLKFSNIIYEALFLKKNSEFIVFYQGIMDNKSRKIYKYEALARLKSEDKIYTPYFFLDNVKNSGFAINLTKEIIDKAFAYLATLDRDISFSINITEDDLQSVELIKFFKEKLRFYNIDASKIILEILEGVTSSGAKNNIKQLKELKKLEFKIAIDDFGVEYSNFERIQEIDVDFIKIDAKYIKDIDKNEKSYEIVKAITSFAHSLDIEVIAEYVENESIQKVVEEIGIDFSQGYYFSVPRNTI